MSASEPTDAQRRREQLYDFLRACHRGDVKDVRRYLATADFDLNGSARFSYEHKNGLQLACESNHYRIVKLLLADPRIDPKANITEMTKSAFLISCLRLHSKCVKLFLKHTDTDPNETVDQPALLTGRYGYSRFYNYFQLVLDRCVTEKYFKLLNDDFDWKNAKKILAMLVFAGATCDDTRVDRVFSHMETRRSQRQFRHKKSVRKLIAKMRAQYDSYKTKYSTYFVDQNMQMQLLLSKTMQDDAERNGAAGLPVTLNDDKFYNLSVGDNITKFLAPPMSLFEFCMQQYKLERSRHKKRERESEFAAASALKKMRTKKCDALRF